jgi:hypothetical protein
LPTPPEAITGTLTASLTAPGEFQVEAGLGAVAVHAGEQDLAGAAPRHLARPRRRRPGRCCGGRRACRRPSRARGWRRRRRCALGVDRHDDALGAVLAEAAEITSGSATAAELKLVLSAPALSRRRTSSTVRTPPPTVSGMNTCEATAFDDVQDQVAAVAGGRDVQEGELVGALLVVPGGDLHGVAGIAQFHEVDALDDPAAGDVQAGDDALGEQGGYPFSSSARFCALAKSRSPE